MTYINHRFRNFCTIILSLITVSSFVSAQEVDISKFTANSGIYDPILFGDDITFDACGSTFEDYSLCELTDLSAFELTWRIAIEGQDISSSGTLAAVFGTGGTSIDTTGQTLNTIVGEDPRDGLNFTINTEENSIFFPTPARYTIQLGLLLRGGPNIDLPDGTSVKPPSDNTVIFSETVIALIDAPVGPPLIPPTTVPEPMGYLILIPAFYMIARRQRKLSQVKASSIA